MVKNNFIDLQRQINGLSAKMLLKDLQDLKINGLITWTVNTTNPITVTYELTPYGHTLECIIKQFAGWELSTGTRLLEGNFESY